MANILGIVGSPRKGGNTDVMVSTVLKACQAAGQDAEHVFLDGLLIAECDGGHACWKGHPCSKKDDMNALYPKIAEARALVLGTPVYWYGPTALMKGFLDRFVFFNGPETRKQVRGKKVALVVPFEESDPSVAELLVSQFQRSLDFLEMELVDTILAPGVTRRGEVRDKPEILEACTRLGQRLAGI